MCIKTHPCESKPFDFRLDDAVLKREPRVPTSGTHTAYQMLYCCSVSQVIYLFFFIYLYIYQKGSATHARSLLYLKFSVTTAQPRGQLVKGKVPLLLCPPGAGRRLKRCMVNAGGEEILTHTQSNGLVILRGHTVAHTVHSSRVWGEGTRALQTVRCSRSI